MRYWDSAAIIPLLVREPTSHAAREEHARDVEMVTWWGTPVECVSALARLEREGSLAHSELVVSFQRLDALASGWVEVQPSDRVRATAERLLRVHPLRAGDALQLAAALAAADEHPPSLRFVTRDARLALTAQREGFDVIQPA